MRYVKLVFLMIMAVALFSACATSNESLNEENNVGQRNLNNETGFRNVGYNTQLRRATTDGKMQVADEAANRVANLEEVRRANVIVTNQNAYVAVMLNDNPKGDLTRDIEAKIAREVKATDNNIDRVYVSSNPDFLDRMNDYGYRIQQGEPVQGLFDEFSELVRRVFPNPR